MVDLATMIYLHDTRCRYVGRCKLGQCKVCNDRKEELQNIFDDKSEEDFYSVIDWLSEEVLNDLIELVNSGQDIGF